MKELCVGYMKMYELVERTEPFVDFVSSGTNPPWVQRMTYIIHHLTSFVSLDLLV